MRSGFSGVIVPLDASHILWDDRKNSRISPEQ
jgi:hypothetical protein